MSRTTQLIQSLGIDKQELIDRIPLQALVNRFTSLKSIGNGKYQGLCCFHSERSGSLVVDENKDIYKCFGCGKGGKGIFNFIMDKEHLTFIESLEYLSKEFNIISTNSKLISVPRRIIISEEKLIEVNECKFERKHKDYWNKYLLPEAYLNSKNVVAVKKLAYNKKIINIENEAVFGYYAPEINKWKILRIGPDITKKDKWRSTIPLSYLYYFPKKHVKDLWIVKSVKDLLVMDYHFGLICTATGNEDAINLLHENYDKIQPIADRKIILFGNDFQAWHQSYLLTEYTDWKYFNIPNYMEKMNIVDPSDLIDVIGLEPLKQLLIQKQFI